MRVKMTPISVNSVSPLRTSVIARLSRKSTVNLTLGEILLKIRSFFLKMSSQLCKCQKIHDQNGQLHDERGEEDTKKFKIRNEAEDDSEDCDDDVVHAEIGDVIAQTRGDINTYWKVVAILAEEIVVPFSDATHRRLLLLLYSSCCWYSRVRIARKWSLRRGHHHGMSFDISSLSK
eukprot:TRINITY_DN860_c0_g2_i3.p1 TRINITY_DN860_c0_g2~~TRINITY_DN860_c0_g2_i3.p1  ORF type:complete len:176 (-),score=12.64 TRINITY_DN860_c0_g2_i3:30-557(-)